MRSDAGGANPRTVVVSACAAGLALTFGSAARAQSDPDINQLSQLSIEELADLPVFTVMRRQVPVSEPPASVYVITAEAIRRSGVHSLAEALRLAPNLDVVQLDAVSYAITARGFGGVASTTNKLLVQIDGRSVYSPLFSGVFWHQDNVPLSEIDRIEVVSGPGGTLWGANAMNGVINVITKDSAASQGLRAEAVVGARDQQLEVGFGGRLSENLTWRVYGMGLQRGPTLTPSGAPGNDDWSSAQGGFRLDWAAEADRLTLQGDLYETSVDRGDRNRGQNLLGRWTHSFRDGSNLMVRGYVDNQPSRGRGVVYNVRTYDLLTQYNLALGPHNVVLGGGYRRIHDSYRPTTPNPPFVLQPQSSGVDLVNAFAQDSVALSERLELTAGAKLEHSSYTGTDLLPNVRLGWRTPQMGYVWAAVSRATRTASRFDRDFIIAPVLTGGPDFKAEKLTAYELGWRGRPTKDSSLSVSLYYSDYSDIRSLELTNGGLPVVIANGVEGRIYGVEAWGQVQATSWLRLNAGLAAMHGDFHAKPGHVDLGRFQALGNNPEIQGSVGSQIALAPDLELDMRLRGVGARKRSDIPAYAEADASLAWRVSPRLELRLTGANLLHDSHVEGVLSGAENRLRRTVSVTARFSM